MPVCAAAGKVSCYGPVGEEMGMGGGYAIPVTTPIQTIDFIAYKTAGAFDGKEHMVIDEKYASDHLPVKAILKLN